MHSSRVYEYIYTSWKLCFVTFLRGIWYYIQVSIIDLSSPNGASLYNIGSIYEVI